MTTCLRDQVIAALDTVKDPCSVFNRTNLTLTELGMLHEVTIADDGAVHVELFLDDPTCIFFFEIHRMLKDAVSIVEGVTAFTVDIKSDALWTEERMTRAGRDRLQRIRTDRRAALDSGDSRGWPLPLVAAEAMINDSDSHRAVTSLSDDDS